MADGLGAVFGNEPREGYDVGEYIEDYTPAFVDNMPYSYGATTTPSHWNNGRMSFFKNGGNYEAAIQNALERQLSNRGDWKPGRADPNNLRETPGWKPMSEGEMKAYMEDKDNVFSGPSGDSHLRGGMWR